MFVMTALAILIMTLYIILVYYEIGKKNNAVGHAWSGDHKGRFSIRAA